MYVCLCHPTTESQIRHEVRRGAVTVEELQGRLGVAAGCGMCRPMVDEILADGATDRMPEPILAPVAEDRRDAA